MSREENKPEDQPASMSDASGFTQLFGKAPLETQQTRQPFAPDAQSPRNAPIGSDQSLTAAFAPTKGTVEKSTPPLPFATAPSPSEAATQLFTAVPPLERSTPSVSATEETRIFSAVPAPESVTVPKPSNAAPPPPSRMASEFTSVFQPIAPPPAMPAPPVAAAIESAPGEFTQFFSAVSVRANAGVPARSAPLSAPQVPAQAASSVTESQAGDFTQLFQQQLGARPLNAGVVPTQPMPTGMQEQSHPGSFTQMFSGSSTAAPVSAPQAPLQAPGAPQPVFGEAAPRGSFTDVFAANPISQAAPERAKAEKAPFFPGEPSPLFTPPPAAKAAHMPSSFGALVPAEPTSMQTPAAGEFTRLMQSLERPASAPSAAAQPLPVDAAFFASSPASAGESEYTRVLRGGAAGSPAGAPMAAPAAGSAAAPGLALAPAPAAEGPQTQAAEKQKQRPLVILLVVMNVLLLIGLLVIGLIVLHRR